MTKKADPDTLFQRFEEVFRDTPLPVEKQWRKDHSAIEDVPVITRDVCMRERAYAFYAMTERLGVAGMNAGEAKVSLFQAYGRAGMEPEARFAKLQKTLEKGWERLEKLERERERAQEHEPHGRKIRKKPRGEPPSSGRGLFR